MKALLATVKHCGARAKGRCSCTARAGFQSEYCKVCRHKTGTWREVECTMYGSIPMDYSIESNPV